MRLSPLVVLGAAVCLASLAPPASAQSLRCKSDLANVGDSKASVLLKCGEPVVKDTFCKPAAQQAVPSAATDGTTLNVVPCETVDEWTYKPGYGQFVTTLRFESGALAAIKYGERIK